MKNFATLKNILPVLFLGTALLSLSGCVYLVVGTVGAVGGYAISSDTVEGTVERDFEEAWTASLDVLNIMGRVVNQHEKDGKLEAIVNGARVNVSLTQYPNQRVKISIKARKSFFPKISTAQDVYVKIVNQLHG